MPALLGWAITMLFVAVGWVMFRAATFDSATSIVMSMAGVNGFGGALLEPRLMVAAALAAALIPSAYEIKDKLTRCRTRAWAAGAAAVAVYCVLEVGRGAPVNFIYFQF